MKKILLLLLALVVGLLWIWLIRQSPHETMTTSHAHVAIPIVRKSGATHPARKRVNPVPASYFSTQQHLPGLLP